MNKCKHCGKEIATDSVYCEHCGAKQIEDKASVWGIIGSFLIPLVGIILWATKKNEKPAAAKKYLWWAVASFALGLVIQIISFVIAASL